MKQLFNHINKINLNQREYSIFGSGPLSIRGLRKSNDIDIIVRAAIFENLKERNQVLITKSGFEVIKIGNIEIFNSWYPGEWDIDELIDNSETIEGYPFVRMDEVLKWKKLRMKPKDVLDIEMINKYLKN